MANTMIDIDEDALEQARLYYGTSTKKETVNRALQDAAARLADRRSSFGKYLMQSVADYERMSEADKDAFWARTDTTDHKLLQQMADAGVVLDDEEAGR